MIFFNEIVIISTFLCSILFWFVIPEQFRTKFLFLASACGLTYFQWKFTFFLIIVILFVFYSALFINKKPNIKYLFIVILILTIILLLFKYMKHIHYFIFMEKNEFSMRYVIPLGISYLGFKLIAFIIDVFRDNIKKFSIEELFAFIFFLPIFPAGPIERYQNFAGKRSQVFSFNTYVQGLKRLALGYFKKVFFVNLILYEIVVKKLQPMIVNDGIPIDISAWIILCFLFGSLLYAYIDLSAYADIAIGFSLLFGYRICENMNYPLFQKNLSDYWNCWHISLAHWCRNNVYFPVIGKTRNNTLALYCSFIVMGLWHYLCLNWFLWGVWHATGITIYSKWNRFKRKHKKIKSILPGKISFAIGVILTVSYSSLGCSFIMMDSTIQSIRILLAIIL